MGSSSGSGGDQSNNGDFPGWPEDGPYDPDENPTGDCCEQVAGSTGLEDDVMRCMKEHANDGIWFPWINDCHNSAVDCLAASNLSFPDLIPGADDRCGDPNYCK